jgi:hypothetical protein
MKIRALKEACIGNDWQIGITALLTGLRSWTKLHFSFDFFILRIEELHGWENIRSPCCLKFLMSLSPIFALGLKGNCLW